MTVTYISRETSRVKLAELLAAELVGEGKPAQKVYDYMPNSAGSESPILIVADRGTSLSPQGMNSKANFNKFHLVVLICTIRDSQAENWTPRESQNAHSTIEAGVRKIISENHNLENYWMNMQFLGIDGPREYSTPSVIVPGLIGGVAYDVETHIVQLEVNDTIS